MEKQQLLDYLYGLERFGMKLGLEEITKLVDALDNPQFKFKTIHVAGTNGKGSTSAFLASILQTAGYKVGLNTSPHLIEFNERIKINGEKISDEELVALIPEIKQKVEENDIQTTFFEFTTALAFKYFEQQKVDYAIIEVGMGGRLDATNVIKPEICVITNIDLDHTKHLGNTKLQIAPEKAAIIKEGSIVVTGEQDPEILADFKMVCEEKNAELFVLNEEISYDVILSGLVGQAAKVTGLLEGNFEFKMLGEHQIKNGLLAALAILKMNPYFSLNAIKQGLHNAKWSGRLELVNHKPLVLIDGAHNVAGAITLNKFLESTVQKIKGMKILILGIAKDKQIPEMVDLIVPFADEVILTQGNFKPAEIEVLKKEVVRHLSEDKITVCPEVPNAIRKALELVTDDGIIIATGSLYMVGDVLKHRNLFKETD